MARASLLAATAWLVVSGAAVLRQRELVGDEPPVGMKLVVVNFGGDEVEAVLVDDRSPYRPIDEFVVEACPCCVRRARLGGLKRLGVSDCLVDAVIAEVSVSARA